MNKFVMFSCGFSLAVLVYMMWDSAKKVEELQAVCQSKQGVIVTMNRRVMCVKKDAFIR